MASNNEATLSLYLLSGGIPYGAFLTVKFDEDYSLEHSSQLNQLQPKLGDVICAATALDLNLGEDAQLAIIRSLREYQNIKEISILFNNVLHTVQGSPETIPQPPPPAVSSSSLFSDNLIFWVRLQTQMNVFIQTKKCSIPSTFFEDLRNDAKFASKHPNLLSIACILQSPAVCWHLSPYVNSDGILNRKEVDVLLFFRLAVHGYKFLSNFNLCSIDEIDDFLKSAIDHLLRHRTAEIRRCISTLFGDYARSFVYLAVTYEGQQYVLERENDRCWQSDDRKVRIAWRNNWTLFLNDQAKATKVVSLDECIPSLSCLQGRAKWTGDVCVAISTKDMYLSTVTSSVVATLHDSQATVNPKSAKVTTNDACHVSRVTFNCQTNVSGGAPTDMRRKILVPSEFFGSTLFFMGWDPVLRVLDNPECYEKSELESLLFRCLWMWANRNDEHNACEEFYKSALCSLEKYQGRASAPQTTEQWKSRYVNFGCIETPRLFTLKERMMLMIACSWPVYFSDNIDQKNGDTLLRIRGMAMMHIRFAKFMRQRMLDFGFIDDDSFPPEFADYSTVNICSNVCRNGLTKWDWRDKFVFDLNIKPMFLRLKGCSKAFNADGIYAATTCQYGNMRVYAFANVQTGNNICQHFSFSLEDSSFTESHLVHPTIILIDFSAGLVLHCVKFAFALNSNECIIKRASNGQYSQFFSVSHRIEEFIYQSITAPVITEVRVHSPENSVDSATSFKFEFGVHVEAVLVPFEEVQGTQTFGFLTDQATHFDGNTKPHSWHGSRDIQIGESTIEMFGVCPAKQLGVRSSFESLDLFRVSRSCMFGVFHDTRIGIIVGRRRVHLSISDGCGFMFSFWFKHFGIGSHLWHWRPHSYYHSSDIRHFPVSTPEGLFVLFAAAKLLKNCNDPLTHGGFERLILETLETQKYTRGTDSPVSFSNMSGAVVLTAIADVYTMVFDEVQDAGNGAVSAFENLDSRIDLVTPELASKPSSSSSIDRDISRTRAFPGEQKTAVERNDQAIAFAPAVLVCSSSSAQNSEPSNVPFNGLQTFAKKQCVLLQSPHIAAVQDDQAIAGTPDDLVDSPPSHLPVIGLPNIGNTCWMNSCLQCLLHTPELSLLFLKSDFDASSLHPPTQPVFFKINKTVQKEFATVFKKLVNYSRSSSKDDAARDELKTLLREFQKAILSILEVRDSQLAVGSEVEISSSEPVSKLFDSSEALLILLEAIHSSLFKIEIEYHRTCNRCGGKYTHLEEPGMLEVSIAHSARVGISATLADCLNAYFVEETVDEVTCSNCVETKTTCLMKRALRNAFPDLCYVMLKRFVGTGKKITRKVVVPLEYDFGQHCMPKQSSIFRLYAVICHTDAHYVTLLKSEFSDSWTMLNDSTVTPMSEKTALNFIQSHGYICFFRRRRRTTSSPSATVSFSATSSPSATVSRPGTSSSSQILIISDSPIQSTPASTVKQYELSGGIYAQTNQQQEIFTLPRHFSFEFGELQIVATYLVEKQNELNKTSVISQFLKQHNDRVYDVNHQYVENIFPEAYTDPKALNALSALSPCISFSDEFIHCGTVKWFFTALTTLFPDAMLLSPGLFTYQCVQNLGQQASLQDWLSKFTKRRPHAVLHPMHLPKHLDQPLSPTNRGIHWILFVLDVTWSQNLPRASSFIFDPCASTHTEKFAQEWCKTITKMLGINSVLPGAVFRGRLQRGSLNHHCGVFTMALGLNFLTRTLPTIESHLIKDLNTEDTSSIGIELRKMVAWDCNHKPAMLNACLAMSPAFAVSARPQPPLASKWWRVAYTHDIVAALSLQCEFQDGGLFSQYGLCSKGSRLGTHFQYDPDKPERFEKVPTDGPFFFQNESFFVKVYCIGLIGRQDLLDRRDTRSCNRAAPAFIDASASDCVCHSNAWWVSTFGLICVGFSTPCAFICVGRQKLSLLSKECNAHNATSVDLGKLFYSIAKKDSVLHGDGYCGNVVVDESGKMQAVDFERASILTGKPPPPLFFQQYARSVVLNKQDSIQILMSQMKKCGMDATRLYFSSFYNGDFLQQTFDSDAFKLSPGTDFRFVGFWKLMDLLDIDANRHGDENPELAILESKMCISCNIRPCFSVYEPVRCNIFFDYTSDGSILICSAAFDSQRFEVVERLQQDFVKHSKYFNLESEQVAQDFFGWALSMESVISDTDNCYSSDTSSSMLPPRKSQRRVHHSMKAGKPNLECELQSISDRDKSLDKQFNFLRQKNVSSDVWLNCVSSVRTKFPDYRQPYKRTSHASSCPNNQLEFSHFGSVFVLVSGRDSETENQCIDFIKSENILSIDTETAYPCFPEQGASISLMQIGTNVKVFLIQVAYVTQVFLQSLKSALGGKTLVHWGGSDKEKVCVVLGDMSLVCWCDLQDDISPLKGQKLGLGSCISTRLRGVYVVSKEWTLSGWDLADLDLRQLKYAGLDVICCYVLYLYHKLGFDTFQCCKMKFHSFLTPKTYQKGSDLIRHGFSFEADRCCHYELGTLVQGLFKDANLSEGHLFYPLGFKKTLWREEFSSNIVSEFVALLNSQKLCCRICFDSKWFQKIGIECPQFRANSCDLSKFTCKRGRGIHTVTVQCPTNMNPEAFFCLSMLGTFLKMKVINGMDYTNLVDSVCSDCRHGFISSTLNYFQVEE